MSDTPTRKLGPGDDLEMMQTPALWPQWPVLPMKRDHEGKREHGIFIELMGTFECAWVPGATMFEVVKRDDPRVQTFSREDTNKYHEILDAGWVVD